MPTIQPEVEASPLTGLVAALCGGDISAAEPLIAQDARLHLPQLDIIWLGHDQVVQAFTDLLAAFTDLIRALVRGVRLAVPAAFVGRRAVRVGGSANHGTLGSSGGSIVAWKGRGQKDIAQASSRLRRLFLSWSVRGWRRFATALPLPLPR